MGLGRNQRATASPPKKAPLKANARREKSEGRSPLDVGPTGPTLELDAGANVGAVWARDGTNVETGDGVHGAAEAGDGATAANCREIAMAASISIGEHVGPVEVGSACTAAGGAGCIAAGPPSVATTSDGVAAASSEPASCSYRSPANVATPAPAASGASVTAEGE